MAATVRPSSPRRDTTTRRRSRRCLRRGVPLRRARRVAHARRDRARAARRTAACPASSDSAIRPGSIWAPDSAEEVALSILARDRPGAPQAARPRQRGRARSSRRTRCRGRARQQPARRGRHRSRVRHERDDRRRQPHGGGRRRRLLLLLRELPRDVPEGSRRRYLAHTMTDAAAIHDPLPRARLHRRRGVRHRAADHARAREAAAHRGPGRRRQDRERESARRGARHAADPPAVLRGARRDGGALRVELSAPDAARAPERDRGCQPRTSAKPTSSASGSC